MSRTSPRIAIGAALGSLLNLVVQWAAAAHVEKCHLPRVAESACSALGTELALLAPALMGLAFAIAGVVGVVIAIESDWTKFPRMERRIYVLASAGMAIGLHQFTRLS